MGKGQTKRVGELEIEEDIHHQRREWKAERIGWTVMALLVVAALLGLLGNGPLSNVAAGPQGSELWLDYQRFARYSAPFELKVHFRPAGDLTRISLNRNFYEAVEVETILPEPEKTEVLHDRAVFDFPSSGPRDERAVTFVLKPKQRWRQQVEIRLDDRRAQALSIFVYP